MKRGYPLPEGIEARPIQPIIETVSDILALEIRKTMDFYRATAEESEEAIQKILSRAAVRSFLVCRSISRSVSRFRLSCLIRFGRSKLTAESLIRTT